jgi:hypothetical protein
MVARLELGKYEITPRRSSAPPLRSSAEQRRGDPDPSAERSS